MSSAPNPHTQINPLTVEFVPQRRQRVLPVGILQPHQLRVEIDVELPVAGRRRERQTDGNEYDAVAHFHFGHDASAATAEAKH